jgi:Kef-type K+ transport system membrane component KefB
VRSRGRPAADSEFRHELEADVEPFKGLLLGLFHGRGDERQSRAVPGASVCRAWRRGWDDGIQGVAAVRHHARREEDNADAQRIAGLLSQVANSLVLFTAAQVAGILAAETSQFLVLAVTISMLLARTPFAS